MTRAIQLLQRANPSARSRGPQRTRQRTGSTHKPCVPACVDRTTSAAFHDRIPVSASGLEVGGPRMSYFWWLSRSVERTPLAD